MQTVVIGGSQNRLRDVLSFVGREVPYYRDMFSRCRIDISLVEENLQEFFRIPFMTKEILRTNKESLVAESALRTHLEDEITSGSTGMHLSVKRSSIERLISERNIWKARLRWNDALLRTPHVLLMPRFGSYIPPMLQEHRGLRQSSWSIDLTSDPIPEFSALVSRIESVKPGLITAPVSVARRLAELILDGSVVQPRKSPLLLETFMEFLSMTDRRMLEDAIGCPVADNYSSRETYGIGYTCPYGNMHIMEDNVFVEIGESQYGESLGEVVVTSLVFKNMPIIRYRLGDIVVERKEKCYCGNNSPLIGLTQGRVTDTIPGYPGLISSFVVLMIFNNLVWSGYSGIKDYRIVQKRVNYFEVLLVTDRFYTNETERELRSRVATVFSHSAFDIVVVDRIPFHPSGKKKIFISEVI